MNTRIKTIRKSLGLTQQVFAERIGLKQNTIATIESGKRVPSDQVVLSICREYSVRYDWLTTGEGPIFEDQGEISLDELAQERACSEMEIKILRAYFEIDPDVRRRFLENLQESIAAERAAQSKQEQ